MNMIDPFTIPNSAPDSIVSNSVLVLKYLIQTKLSTPQNNLSNTSEIPRSIISQLAQKISDIKHDQARACVLWLVGQYSASEEPGSGVEGVTEWAPDVLRKATRGFSQEVGGYFVGMQTEH
jgi:AP-3 complex subunit beta